MIDKATKFMKTKLFPKSIWNPLLTLVTLFFFQNWTGFIATVFYGVDIFQVCKLMMGPSINYVDIFLGVFLTLLHLSGHLCSKVIIRYPPPLQMSTMVYGCPLHFNTQKLCYDLKVIRIM